MSGILRGSTRMPDGRLRSSVPSLMVRALRVTLLAEDGSML